MSNYEPPDEQPRDMDCFEASYTSVILNPSLVLMHGLVTEGEAVRVKAWVELGETVIDSETNSSMPMELFYSTYEVQLSVAYDRDEAYQEFINNDNSYGYWHPILKQTMKEKK